MTDSGERRPIREWFLSLTAGLIASLIASLIAYETRAHLLEGIAVAILACFVVIGAIHMTMTIAIPRRLRRRPLVVRITGNPQWLDQRNDIWILATELKIKNRTREAVGIRGYEIEYETPSGIRARTQPSDEDVRAVEQVTNSDSYFPPLHRFHDVPARKSISGWYVAAVSRDPAGGTPKCVVTVIDIIGRRYSRTIPAQQP